MLVIQHALQLLETILRQGQEVTILAEQSDILDQLGQHRQHESMNHA